jgi:FkbM family methyltransferase
MKLQKDIDPELTKAIRKELHYYKSGRDYIKKQEQPIVVDLGAYIGLTADYFNIPDSTIYAVEANPTTYDCLKVNMAHYNNVIPIHGAIGFREGNRIMLNDGSKVSMNIYPATQKPVVSSFEVPGMTFDRLYAEYINQKIDLLKVDIEGCEYELFLSDGFRKVSHMISYIIGEAHKFPMDTCFLPVILKESGFKMKWLPYKNYNYITTYKVGSKEGALQATFNTMFVATRI